MIWFPRSSLLSVCIIVWCYWSAEKKKKKTFSLPKLSWLIYTVKPVHGLWCWTSKDHLLLSGHSVEQRNQINSCIFVFSHRSCEFSASHSLCSLRDFTSPPRRNGSSQHSEGRKDLCGVLSLFNTQSDQITVVPWSALCSYHIRVNIEENWRIKATTWKPVRVQTRLKPWQQHDSRVHHMCELQHFFCGGGRFFFYILGIYKWC